MIIGSLKCLSLSIAFHYMSFIKGMWSWLRWSIRYTTLWLKDLLDLSLSLLPNFFRLIFQAKVVFFIAL